MFQVLCLMWLSIFKRKILRNAPGQSISFLIQIIFFSSRIFAPEHLQIAASKTQENPNPFLDKHLVVFKEDWGTIKIDFKTRSNTKVSKCETRTICIKIQSLERT